MSSQNKSEAIEYSINKIRDSLNNQPLCRTFPFIDVRKRLITTQCKQMIKLDILIDDCVDNLVGGEYKGILMNYSWNSNFDDTSDNKIYRAFDWAQVKSVIENITTNINKEENNGGI